MERSSAPLTYGRLISDTVLPERTPKMLARHARMPYPDRLRRVPGLSLLLVSSLGLAARLNAQPATLVKDINPGTGQEIVNVHHSDLTRSGNYLYFASDSGAFYYFVPRRWNLWKSDGTASGTSMVADNINAGDLNNQHHPTNLTDVNGTLFFTWGDDYTSQGLWSTDGTSAGTRLLLSPSISVGSLRSLGNSLYFFTSGSQLWKSDGTPSGTAEVTPVPNASELVVAGNVLFLAVGSQLWKSDGTAPGTVLVKDIASGGSGSLGSLTAAGSTLFFHAGGSQHGCELWTSDGTGVGTKMVLDINPGPSPASSNPSFFFPFNGGVLFAANDGSTGNELWFSDGTPSGTKLVADINPGSADSFPA